MVSKPNPRNRSCFWILHRFSEISGFSQTSPRWFYPDSTKIYELVELVNSKNLPDSKALELNIHSSDVNDNTLDLKKYYVVLSPLLTKSNNDLSKVLYKKYLNFKNSAKVSGDFQYNSGSNKKFLSVAQLKKLLQ